VMFGLGGGAGIRVGRFVLGAFTYVFEVAFRNQVGAGEGK